MRVLGALASQAGLTGYNLYLLRTLKHQEWLYRGYGKVPFPRLTFLPPSDPASADIALCERLVHAYRRAVEHPLASENLSAIWTEKICRYQGRLVGALREGNGEVLSTILSTLFKEGFLRGIATGDLYTHASSRVGSRIWSLKCLDDVVSLAEYLGVVRTECPEQGVVAFALRNGFDDLVERIEEALGISIGFPPVGAPYGFRARGSLVTMEAPEHIYVASRLARGMADLLPPEFSSSPNIVEIGAGFGGTAYWLLRLRNMAVGRYTLVDLPSVNILQGYFLAKVFGPSRIGLFGEAAGGATSERIVRVLPPQGIGELNERDVDVLINQNSMPEMSETAALNYLTWAKENVRGFFYSYNQEAYSPVNGVPQLWVREIVKRAGGFRLMARTASWMRRGYVEEVYCSLNAGLRGSTIRWDDHPPEPLP